MVDGGATISTEALGNIGLYFEGSWIDIAGQCANTIRVRNSGACGM